MEHYIMDNFDIQEKMQKLSFTPSTDTCRFFGLLLGWFGLVFWGFVVGVVFVFNRKQERVVFKSFLSLGSNHMVCTK